MTQLRDTDPSRIGTNTYPQALYCTRAKHILYAVSCCKNPAGANQSASAELAIASWCWYSPVVWDGTMVRMPLTQKNKEPNQLPKLFPNIPGASPSKNCTCHLQTHSAASWPFTILCRGWPFTPHCVQSGSAAQTETNAETSSRAIRHTEGQSGNAANGKANGATKRGNERKVYGQETVPYGP